MICKLQRAILETLKMEAAVLYAVFEHPIFCDCAVKVQYKQSMLYLENHLVQKHYIFYNLDVQL